MDLMALYLLAGIMVQAGVLSMNRGAIFDKYPLPAKFNGMILLALLWPVAVIAFGWYAYVRARDKCLK